VAQLADIGVEKIVTVRGRCAQGLGGGNALDAIELPFEQAIGRRFNRAGDLAAGRAAIGRVVLEAAIARWIVR
jgi:hypothetical protein